MAGSKAGAKKAKATIYKKYGKDFFAKIGKKGGQNGHSGGFAADKELARRAGRKGGKVSKRGAAKRDDEGNVLKKDGTIAKKQPGRKPLDQNVVRERWLRNRIKELELLKDSSGLFTRLKINKEIDRLKEELKKVK